MTKCSKKTYYKTVMPKLKRLIAKGKVTSVVPALQQETTYKQ